MSKIIEDYLETFTPSRPIFTLSEKYKGYIEAETAVRVTTSLDHPVNDILSRKYVESFDSVNLKFVCFKKSTRDSTMEEVVCAIRRLFVSYGGYSSPQQTLMYKWLRKQENLIDVSVLSDNFLMLYKYARSFCGEDMVVDLTVSNNSKHVNNVLGILELMRQKHEKSK